MTCQHNNIYWEDLLDERKLNADESINKNFQWHDICCLDCNETKGWRFAHAAQKWYHKKIKEWLINNELATKRTNRDGENVYLFLDFLKFVKENSNGYEKYWHKLSAGAVDLDHFEGLGGQFLFKEVSIWIENFCRQFKKQKEKDDPEREREREREQIRRKIKRLEKKTNRTPEEEAELADLRTRLRELEQQTEKQPVNYLPWIIGGSVLVVGIIISFLLFRKKEKSYY